MGVPKFFRYINERYPCLSEPIKSHQISDFDNLYLDMNGIIHNCSHPNDSDPHFRITEEKIFSDIFYYISALFQLIRPKKVFYMAIDGVAPRAKMNQQRGRRFRTAKEAFDLEVKAKEKGEKLPDEKRFDSNCITPGTVFMDRLHQQLRYFVKQKISTDSLWAKCRIVLSGHETPGEGEHKIMEYIRYLRTQPDHDPNTRHCLYGLDADLIMLGMCIHEPNFSLLREEVKFGKHAQKASSPDDTTFFLLHLSLLKDYLEQEFISIKEKLQFGFDIEKIVDDWVLMAFLVGNDFIPPLPHLHIHADALPQLYETYKNVIVNLDGYINENGILNLKRFETFMIELSKFDKENFQDTTYVDLKYFESKTGRRPNFSERKSYKSNIPDDNETFFNLDKDDAEWNPNTQDLKKLMLESEDLMDPESEYEEEEFVGESSDDDAHFNKEFKLHRHDYYKTKLDYANVTPEVLQSQAECYVRAIQWVLHYYYQGCVSWSWYYPHHYAPYITDIVHFENMDLTFDIGTPFKPFEQLLSVLPAASKELLPEPFQHLMTNESSSIYSYYPDSFETDLNGKRNEWEAVVLIPFIDENKLLSAMEPIYAQLTEDELRRNTHGPMFIYDYTPQDLGESLAPEYFPDIPHCHAREIPVYRSELDLTPEQVVRGLLPNPQRGLFFPGIPSLKTLQFTSNFTKAQVKVFDQPSRNENCILRITYDIKEEPTIEELAGKLLGKIIWVNWPHLHRAKVQQISNEKGSIKYIPQEKSTGLEDDEIKYVCKNGYTSKITEFDIDTRTITDHHSRRLGVEIGDIKTIIHAVSLKGFSHVFGTDGTIINGVEWCSVSSPYPLQAVLPKLDVAPLFSTRNLSVQDVLPKGEKVFLKANPYYGSFAEVIDSTMLSQTGRIKINVLFEPEPLITPKQESKSAKYMTSNNAAARCGISSFLLSRLTGSIYVSTSNNTEIRGKSYNIGLDMKFNKKNEELCGYTKRIDTRWMYSQKCVDVILDYYEKFPDLFQKLEARVGQDRYTEKDLFPDAESGSQLVEIHEWLKNHPYKKASLISCNSDCLEPDVVIELNESIMAQKPKLQQQKKAVVVQVRPRVILKPGFNTGTLPPDPQVCDFRLYHRVVNVNPRSTVPLGLKGTVVGISQSRAHADTVNLSDKLNEEPMYHVLFDEPFLGGIAGDGLKETRLFKMLGFNLLNISQGRGQVPELGKTMDDLKLSSNTYSAADNLKNLRKGDGRNSAFANYTSPTKSHSKNNVVEDYPKPNIKHQPQQQPKPPAPVQIQKPPPPVVNDEQSNMLKSLLNINRNEEPMRQPPPMRFPQPPPVFPSPSFLPHWNYPPPPTQHMPPPHYPPYPMDVYYNNVPNMQHANRPPPQVPPLQGPPSQGPLPQGPPPQGPAPHMSSPNILQNIFINSNQPQAPKDLKLPFPKFIDQNMHSPNNNGFPQQFNLQRANYPPPNNVIPSQFIPLQAVRQRCSVPPLGNKHYRKGSVEKSNPPSASSSTLIQGQQTDAPQDNTVTLPQATQASPAEVPKQVKKRKSRIAANFGNSSQ